MAWNEPGGNKNNKPNDPWGSGGQKPPDLEQIITEFVNKIKNALGMNPNQQGGSALPVVIILMALVGFALWTSAHRIGPSERGVVLTFGKYSKTMQPGLNFTWPAPISKVYKVDTKKVHSVSESGEMLTEDKNLVFLDFTIQYTIREDQVQDYLFSVENPHSTVKHASESAARQVVGINTMSHILNEDRKIASNNILDILQDILDEYKTGIQISSFNIKEIHPPSQVKGAFDDVIKAREDAKTFVNEANEYARKEVPLAEGNALKIIQEAEAYKESIIAKSEGEAEKFNLVREQFELAPEVTKERMYLETMEKVFGNTSKVLIDSESNNSMMYLPLDQMLKRKDSNTSLNLPNMRGSVTQLPNQSATRTKYESQSNTRRTGRGR